MDRFQFSVKRVFRRSVQLGEMMTSCYGLTPARFDLMRAIECQRRKWLPLSDVRALLGVSGPTVSRMVKALVKRGYLERRRDPEDGRRRQVHITDLGRRALGCAVQHIVKSGYMREVTGRVVSDYTDFGRATKAERALALEQMMALLHTAQANLGDTSRFEHDDRGHRPPPIDLTISNSDRDEQGNWPGDDPAVYAWIIENLPVPGIVVAACIAACAA
jgi:DNA-binding MarR family transcriptional regulator